MPLEYFIPADVPPAKHQQYLKNMQVLTHNTQRLFLFATDQKIEHLNEDFEPPHAHPDAQDPHHIFSIAAQSPIGALATHLGLVARYAPLYNNISYIVKLNGKTHKNPENTNPLSAPLYSVDDVLAFRYQTKIPVVGIGLTMYVGSLYEAEMLNFAAQSILHAHHEGLVAIAWVYARGAAIVDETDPSLAAGLAGLGTSLGADFVKIKPPHATAELSSAEHLKKIVTAAGNTKIICSGGTQEVPLVFLKNVYEQLHVGGTAGCAIGRNIFQRSASQAIALTTAVSNLIYKDASFESVLAFIQ